MPRFVVVFEESYAPQTGSTIIEAEDENAAREQLVSGVPGQITVNVLNVFPL